MVCPAGRGAGPAAWGQLEEEQLRRGHAELAARVQDMLDNARIKNQAIDMKTLENLLHKKTKEMSDQLSDIDLKEKELAKAKEPL